MSRKRMMVLLGILISIIFLYIAFRDQQWAEIINAFQDVNYLWLVPASMFILADYVFLLAFR